MLVAIMDKLSKAEADAEDDLRNMRKSYNLSFKIGKIGM